MVYFYQMSADITKYKEKLFSIQILDQGVSIFTEKFTDFLNIDDVLVFGFISALYSYTYAIGHEEVVSIDFGTSKFLFSELYDGKLLVIITKEDLHKGVETELIQNISLRIEGDIIQPHFVVQVGSGSSPRLTDGSKLFTPFDPFTYLHI